LDVTKALRPWRHLRVYSLAKPAVVILLDAPQLKKLGARKLVANAL